MQDDLLPLATEEHTHSNQPSLGPQCNQLENISIIVLILVDLRGGRWVPQYIQPMTCRGRHWFKQVSERESKGNLNGNGMAKSLSTVQCMCDIRLLLPNQCSSTEWKKKKSHLEESSVCYGPVEQEDGGFATLLPSLPKAWSGSLTVHVGPQVTLWIEKLRKCLKAGCTLNNTHAVYAGLSSERSTMVVEIAIMAVFTAKAMQYLRLKLFLTTVGAWSFSLFAQWKETTTASLR